MILLVYLRVVAGILSDFVGLSDVEGVLGLVSHKFAKIMTMGFQ